MKSSATGFVLSSAAFSGFGSCSAERVGGSVVAVRCQAGIAGFDIVVCSIRGSEIAFKGKYGLTKVRACRMLRAYDDARKRWLHLLPRPSQDPCSVETSLTRVLSRYQRLLEDVPRSQACTLQSRSNQTTMLLYTRSAPFALAKHP